jgi:DNA-binding NarL/FixJ family response regulator
VLAGERYVERDLAAELALHTLGPAEPNKALSARELDIMRLLAQGKDLTSIADQLGISYKTVANSCTGIKQKLMVERSSDLIRIAVELHAE